MGILVKLNKRMEYEVIDERGNRRIKNADELEINDLICAYRMGTYRIVGLCGTEYMELVLSR